jgi:branched-subunit amino acid ABC-type transport system permease component
LGVAIVVQNLVGVIFGRGFLMITTSLSRSVKVVEGLYVAPLTLIAVICALALLAVLHVLLKMTPIGAELRALADNPELVRVFGLDPRWISTCAFAIGSLLVVPAAAITCATSGLSPTIGGHVMLISLASAIVGGMGSVTGPLIAGFGLGLAESLTLIAFDAQWSDGITFAALFFFMMVRPSGLFGRTTMT